MLNLSLFARIAKEFGTPVYVYKENKIREALGLLRKNINSLIFYAMKANNNPEILKILLREGISGIDADSPEEITLALKAGFKPKQIVFTGNNITDEETDFAVNKKVRLNIDSLSRLEKLGKKYGGSEIWVRINSSIGAGHHSHCITGGPESKFGIWYTETGRIKRLAKKYGVKIVGLHQHIGSQILELKIFLELLLAEKSIEPSFPENSLKLVFIC